MLENQFLFETMNTYLESLEYLYRKLRLRKANEKLSRLYVLDSLTGLYNRMAYQEFAEPLYEKCRLQKFDTGEGQIRQHGDGSIEEDFRGGPVKTDSNVTD